MKHRQAHLAVLAANIIYGANYSIAKMIMPEYIKPFGFIMIRVCVAAVLFGGLSFFIKNEKVDRKDIPLFVACAIFGVAFNQLLFFKGLSMTSPINSGLMMISNPVFVLVLSVWFLKEKITGLRIAGILIAIVGCVILILYGGRFSKTTSSALGDFFVLLNSLSFAVYLILSKPLIKKYHPFTIMKWVFTIGALFVIPFGCGEFLQVGWNLFDFKLWSALAFVVLGTTFFAYLLNTIGLITLSPSVVSIYIYLQPLLAAVFAFFIGQDVPHVLHLFSGIMICTGVYICIRQPQPDLEKSV